MILVVGLGPIGTGLGLRLVDLQRSVVGLDLDSSRVDAWLAQSGARGAGSWTDVPWADVEHVLVAVRLPEHAFTVLDALREHQADREMSVFIVTTLPVAAARELARYSDTAWRLFESPVSGGQAAVRPGRLTFLLFGPAEDPADTALVTDLSSTVHRFGSYGQPALTKLLNNTVAAHNLRGLAETAVLAAKQGIQVSEYLAAVQSSSGGSFIGKLMLALSRNELDLLAKDVRLVAADYPALSVLDGLDGFEDLVEEARAARDSSPKPLGAAE